MNLSSNQKLDDTQSRVTKLTTFIVLWTNAQVSICGLQVHYRCQIAYLNCMMVKDVFSVFRRLYIDLSGKSAVGKTTVKDMEKLVTTSKQNL